MNFTLEDIIQWVQEKDVMHAKKIRKNLKSLNEKQRTRCEAFLQKFYGYLNSVQKTPRQAVDDYMRMIADFMYEQIRFRETGKYSNTSFDEVNQRVYNNPEVMEYFMNGLLLSQVLWKHHYAVFTFFSENLKKYASHIHSYLEVGGGHGLFISEAIEQLGNSPSYTLVDISPVSIEVSKKFVCNSHVNYVLADIFDFSPARKFDFISMGEVLEHVENPVALMNKLKSLLNENGTVFLTTPTNAPSIDHIYLFRDENDIKEIFDKSNFKVIEELKAYSEDLPEETAKELQITMLYACFLKPVS